MKRFSTSLPCIVAVLLLNASRSLGADEQFHFRRSSAILQDESRTKLDQVAQTRSECLALGGFINLNASSSYLSYLGRARTLMIFKELTQRGVSPQHIVIKSIGTTNETDEYRNTDRKNFVTVTSMAATACEKAKRPIDLKLSGAPTSELKIHFDLGKVDPQDISKEDLSRFWNGGSHDGTRRIIIEGHTDLAGGYQYNLLVSKLRALKAYQLLVNAGIPGNLIDVRYFGDTIPKTSENRRVSIVWNKDDWSNKQVTPNVAAQPASVPPATEEPAYQSPVPQRSSTT
jgi:outer membrane protein OmpA-like peptidoglycan-associated protein